MKVPVLFICFNRPDLAIKSFQAIKRYKPDLLYLAADGPRDQNKEDIYLCEETRNMILKEINWPCKINKLFRDNNKGCGTAIFEAISWLFTFEEYGIIIEDDCLLSDDSFKFCEELLVKYKDNERIAQINLFSSRICYDESDTYFFTSYPEIWGWATWRRSWVNIDFEMKEWKRQKWKTFKLFSLPEAMIHYYMWQKTYKYFKKNEVQKVWDSQWSIYIFFNNKICINPYSNLVKNIGAGDNATNCINSDSDLFKITIGRIRFPIMHPNIVDLNKKIEKICSDRYIMYYFKLFYRRIIKNVSLIKM